MKLRDKEYDSRRNYTEICNPLQAVEVKLALDGQIFVESGEKIGHILELECKKTVHGTKV